MLVVPTGVAPLKRRLVTPWMIVSSLALGAVVTVLVSWSFAMYGNTARLRAEDQPAWPGPKERGWPARPKAATVHEPIRVFGGSWYWWAWGNHDGSDYTDYEMFVTQAGWPLPAMASTLRVKATVESSMTLAKAFDNEGTFDAGIAMPLHLSAPHHAGPEGWNARRLPLQPLPIGFLSNTLLASALILGLMVSWNAQPRTVRRRGGASWRRPMRAHPAMIVLLAAGANIVVAFGFWTWWQYSKDALTFGSAPRFQGDEVYAFLPKHVARWPTTVPDKWLAPGWIARSGDVPGVRAFEYTSLPPNDRSRHMYRNWLRATWIVQAGWPLPCLQSEELIQPVDEDTPPLRIGVVTNVTMPGAPEPNSLSEPTPFVPVRPLALGMVVNTALFATVFAVVMLAPIALRTLLRRRRGQCVACGYDLRVTATTAPCPECGRVMTGPEAP
jgi:hypothetical protein